MSIVVPLSTTNYGDALSSCGRAGEVRPRGQTRFDRFELVQQLPGQRPRSREIVRERPPARLSALFGGAPEVVENLRDQTLELLDVAPHEEKLALDLLDGQIVGHHLLDAQDLADHGSRVHPLRALVLALFADAHAARQKPELNVLAERRLAELDAGLGGHAQDLGRRESGFVLSLE